MAENYIEYGSGLVGSYDSIPTPQPTIAFTYSAAYAISMATITALCLSGCIFGIVCEIRKKFRVQADSHHSPPRPGPSLVASIPACPYEETAIARRVSNTATSTPTPSPGEESTVNLPCTKNSSLGSELPQLYIGREEEIQYAPGTETCAICLSDLNGGGGGSQLCKELRCGHCYHAECLDSWLMRSIVCPLCKCRAESTRTPDDAVRSPTTREGQRRETPLIRFMGASHRRTSLWSDDQGNSDGGERNPAP